MKAETVRTFIVNGVTYHAGRLPGRKRPSLIAERSTGLWPAASFASEEDADAFNEWLDGLADLIVDSIAKAAATSGAVEPDSGGTPRTPPDQSG